VSAFDDACDRVLSRLEERGVGVRVVGAAALAAHGVSRSTRDLDLLVVDRSVLDETLWDGVATEGMELSVRVGDPTDPLEGVVRLEEVASDEADWGDAVEQLDVVVLRALWARDMLKRPGPPVPVGSRRVSAVDAADLVLLKLYAGGPKDRWDIVSLLEGVADRQQLVEDVDQRIGSMRPSCQALWAELRGV